MINFYLKVMICLAVTNILLPGAQSQNYLISFTGSGQSNTIETIEVKNISQQTTLTLNGNDTLHLMSVVGINQVQKKDKIISVYPNPALDYFHLEFYNPSQGNSVIEVYDITGKPIIQHSIFLITGLHSFRMSGLSAGAFMVIVNLPTHQLSQRVISIAETTALPVLTYYGIGNSVIKSNQEIKNASIVAMQYNEGERLVFEAVSGEYLHRRSIIPTENLMLDFEFIECRDPDNRNYGIVTIGSQLWMAENLAYLPQVNPSWQWDYTRPYYYVFAYQGTSVPEAMASPYYQRYGVLYNWVASNISCPAGWHLPSHEEWLELTDYIGSFQFIGIGNQLKSCRQNNSPLDGNCLTNTHPRWNEHDVQFGTDDFGFSGLPGSLRSETGFGFDPGRGGSWWTSSIYSSWYAWHHSLDFNNSEVSSGGFMMEYGLSVRCVKTN
jgi:uncharacterized protein (TIGR02145 family)